MHLIRLIRFLRKQDLRKMSYLKKIERLMAQQAKEKARRDSKAPEPLRNVTNTIYPGWYTEEDRKVMAVLKGICQSCAHLWLLKDNNSKHEFKGIWCATLKVKLETKVESCPKFYALRDEIERVTKQTKLNESGDAQNH